MKRKSTTCSGESSGSKEHNKYSQRSITWSRFSTNERLSLREHFKQLAGGCSTAAASCHDGLKTFHGRWSTQQQSLKQWQKQKLKHMRQSSSTLLPRRITNQNHLPNSLHKICNCHPHMLIEGCWLLTSKIMLCEELTLYFIMKIKH